VAVYPCATAGADVRAPRTLHAVHQIAARGIEVALPQLFCRAGMTDCRALPEVLGVPYPGNRPLRMASCADKAKTGATVAAAGVAVPHARQYAAGERPTLALPVIVKPNGAHDPLVERVHAAARVCHRTLGCRQYSLFDLRIDPDGKPWFLESGLYCSFAPNSVVVTMAEAAGTPLNVFLGEAIEAVLDARRPVRAA